MDEPTESDRYLCGILFRLHRVPNQINSVLDGLSCSEEQTRDICGIESGAEVKENKGYYLALVYGTDNVIVYY